MRGSAASGLARRWPQRQAGGSPSRMASLHKPSPAHLVALGALAAALALHGSSGEAARGPVAAAGLHSSRPPVPEWQRAPLPRPPPTHCSSAAPTRLTLPLPAPFPLPSPPSLAGLALGGALPAGRVRCHAVARVRGTSDAQSWRGGGGGGGGGGTLHCWTCRQRTCCLGRHGCSDLLEEVGGRARREGGAERRRAAGRQRRRGLGRCRQPVQARSDTLEAPQAWEARCRAQRGGAAAVARPARAPAALGCSAARPWWWQPDR